MRRAITAVLPVPAPAMIRSGPSVVVTAWRCSEFKSTRISLTAAWARSPEPVEGREPQALLILTRTLLAHNIIVRRFLLTLLFLLIPLILTKSVFAKD